MDRSSPRATVLLVNQYFWPDVAATAQLLTDLAEDLAAAGFSVAALAGRRRYASAEGAAPTTRQRADVHVDRVWCTRVNRTSRFSRLLHYVSFLMSAAWRLMRMDRPDIVVCLSTPPLVGVLGLLSRLRGSRLVYKVEDLYPEIAVELGALRADSLATRASRRVSGAILSRSHAVVVLDEGMRSRVETASMSPVHVIPNWADGEAIRPDAAAGRRFRHQHGWGEAFVVLYSGNMGLAHRFDAIGEAARALRDAEPDIRFVFVGQGARRPALEEATRGLDNVSFLDYQPREALSELYNAADIHLVSLRYQVSGLLWPSKYPAALAAGKPVLFLGLDSSSLFAEVEEAGVGWSTRHVGPDVAQIIVQAKSDRAATAERGLRARRHFERHYSRALLTTRWLKLLESVSLQPRRAPSGADG